MMQDEERIEPTFQMPGQGDELRVDPASVNLEESLKKAEAAAKENYDAWLRAKAETDNARKRAQTDVANAHKYAIENFASELLAVKDALEAALNTENRSLE